MGKVTRMMANIYCDANGVMGNVSSIMVNIYSDGKRHRGERSESSAVANEVSVMVDPIFSVM